MKSVFWNDKKVLITGGYGFLGKQVVLKLHERGLPKNRIILFHKADFDLRKKEEVKRLFARSKDVNIVIHLAGDVG